MIEQISLLTVDLIGHISCLLLTRIARYVRKKP